MSESIGMMDKAYFVGKVVILQWFNELLDVRTQSQLLTPISAKNIKDRGVRNGSRLLRCHGLSLSKYFPLQQSKVERKTRV
jgi:hypothetical protein